MNYAIASDVQFRNKFAIKETVALHRQPTTKPGKQVSMNWRVETAPSVFLKLRNANNSSSSRGDQTHIHRANINLCAMGK